MTTALEKIRAKMGRTANIVRPTNYLDTGDPKLNGVLGNEHKGIPYGSIVEISGMPSNGKTALVMDICAAAQADGAQIVWLDFENSFAPEWAASRGLKVDDVPVIFPYVGQFTSPRKEKRLVTGEELLAETEALMNELKKKKRPIVLALDSITAILPEDEMDAGLENANMRTNMALPMLLGRTMRRWIALVNEWNAIILLINQLREKPMGFGDPHYTPGGNAIPFYAHIRARIRRVKGGRILSKKAVVGIKGILANTKNKAGGCEGATTGFKIYFNGQSKFVDPSELES